MTLSETLFDLCAKNNRESNYSEYSTVISSSCDCSDAKKCIRKCCRFGFYHNFTRDDNKDSRCIKNDTITFSNFSVDIYKQSRRISKTNVFVIGMLNCNNTMKYQYFKMNNRDPSEKYYLQNSGLLYYPNSKRKFYSNDRYCVDEEDGLTVYLCYTPENPQKGVSRLLNSTGIYFLRN